MQIRNSKSLALVAAVLTCAPIAFAEIAPYTADSGTAFLWHFDEGAGATAAASAVLGKNSLIAVDGNPTPNPLPLSGGILGSTGPSGFGNAASIGAGDLGLGYDGNGNGVFNPDITGTPFGPDAISTTAFTGANGAFTLEALVNLSSLTSAANREIIAMDNSGTNPERPFQFVITSTGALRFREFANNVTFELAIPTAGADAFAAGAWFHAAYTYDGDGTGRLYWTRLDATREQASLLATQTGLNDLPAASAPLIIGNENRNTFGEGLLGSIDEVRISSVARGAGEFVFVPEPSAAVLLLLGGVAATRRRRGSC